MGPFKELSLVMKKLLLIGALFLGLGIAKAADEVPLVVGPFGTLNNYDSSLAIPSSKAQDLLNVELAPGGASVKKRRGYEVGYTLTITTSPTHGTYRFYDINSNEVMLFFNDRYMSVSINGANPTVLSSTMPFGATYQCVDYAGFAYCANTSRDRLLKINGSSFSQMVILSSGGVSGSTGTILAVSQDRLIMAGFSDFPNRIDFSASAKFTNWTPPYLYGTDPNEITITAPGSQITHITYAFDRLMWFKDQSFGYILFGPNLTDWTLRVVSPTIGTQDNSSIYREGVLYFRGQDQHFYSFDGTNLSRMSRDITNSVINSQVRTIASRSLKTLSTDFGSGVSSNTINTDGIIISSMAAVGFLDVSNSDFNFGTLTNLTADGNSVHLTQQTIAQSSAVANYGNPVYGISTDDSPAFDCVPKAYISVTSTYAFTVSTVRLFLGKSSNPGTVYVYLVDSSKSSVLKTLGSFSGSILPSGGYTAVDFSSFGSFLMSANTQYYFYITHSIFKRISGSGACFGSPSTFVASDVPAPAYSGSTHGSYIIWGTYNSYPASGNMVSRTFDVGTTTNAWLYNWDTFTANSTLNSQTLTFQTQTSTDSTDPAMWDALQSVTSGNVPISSTKRFIRYKASFSTTDQTATPVLNNVSFGTTKFSMSSGTYRSPILSVGNTINAWSNFSANSVLNDGSISYTFIASTNSDLSFSSRCVITSGNIPTVSTKNYVALLATFTVTNATQTPTLNDMSVFWTEGNTIDKAYGGYFDYALWWNVQAYGGAYNNYVFRYDLLNQGWLVYTLPMNGMIVRNNTMYFGSSKDGYIYKFGNVDNDNGTAINSYWQSKDYFGDSPLSEKSFTELSFAAKSVSGTNLNLEYYIGTSTHMITSWDTYNPTSNYIKYNNCQPLGMDGSTINLKFGNNAANQFFEIFAAQIMYRPKPMKDTTR